MTAPAIQTLSLGACIQSTALYLMACEDPKPWFDVAIFADTGWEPAEVYAHLTRLEAVGTIPIRRVSSGNIRNDALDPAHRFASMPLFVKNPDGSDGMARRQCTSEYKLKPIKREVRRLLNCPHPTPVPKGVHAQVAIGISTDEIGRVRDSDVSYMRNVFPLIDLNLSRTDCERYLKAKGWGGSANLPALVAHSTETGSGGNCGTRAPRSSRTPSTSTRPSATAPLGRTPQARTCAARCSCTAPACRSARPRSTGSRPSSGKRGRATFSTRSRTATPTAVRPGPADLGSRSRHDATQPAHSIEENAHE